MVGVVNDQVTLVDVVAKQSSSYTDNHYTANFKLVSNASGVFLNLLDYTTLPQSVDLLLAIANSDTQITLAWDVKNQTNNDLSYLIYASNDEDFQPDSSNLVKTLQNTGQTELTDLTPGLDYYFRLIAQDATSNQSTVSNLISAKTFAQPAIPNSTAIVKQTESLSLGNATNIDSNSLSFDSTDEPTPISQGDILIGNSTNERYLRKVEDVSQSNGEILVTTSNAALSDVFDSASLSSSLLLTNISDENQARNRRARKWKTSNGNQVSQIKWENNLLEITQTNHAYNTDSLIITPSSNGQSFAFEGFSKDANHRARSLSHQLSSEVSIDASIDFQPALETEADWGIFGLNSAKVKATGTLSINLDADFDFEGVVNYTSPTTHILTRTYRSTYLLAGAPVYQEISFSLHAQVIANSEAALKAGAHAFASANVAIGTAYDGNTWSSISEPVTFQKEMTVDMSVKGKVNAEVRLIPNIEVKYYNVVAANLSIEPFVSSEVAAESVLYADIVNTLFPGLIAQMTDFDVHLGLECYTYVNFFQLSVLDKTKICGDGTSTGAIEYPLFSLPELTLSSKQENSSIVATATVEDGINNPFDKTSIKWFTDPEGPVLNVSEDGTTMSFSPDQNVDNYLVYFSGYGSLGELGRQVAETEIRNQDNGCGTLSFPAHDDISYKCTRIPLNQLQAFYTPDAIRIQVSEYKNGSQTGRYMNYLDGRFNVYHDPTCHASYPDCLRRYNAHPSWGACRENVHCFIATYSHDGHAISQYHTSPNTLKIFLDESFGGDVLPQSMSMYRSDTDSVWHATLITGPDDNLIYLDVSTVGWPGSPNCLESSVDLPECRYYGNSKLDEFLATYYVVYDKPNWEAP